MNNLFVKEHIILFTFLGLDGAPQFELLRLSRQRAPPVVVSCNHSSCNMDTPQHTGLLFEVNMNIIVNDTPALIQISNSPPPPLWPWEGEGH